MKVVEWEKIRALSDTVLTGVSLNWFKKLFASLWSSTGPRSSRPQLTIVKVDVKALTVSDVMLAMIGNPFSVVYLSVVLLRH